MYYYPTVTEGGQYPSYFLSILSGPQNSPFLQVDSFGLVKGKHDDGGMWKEKVEKDKKHSDKELRVLRLKAEGMGEGPYRQHSGQSPSLPPKVFRNKGRVKGKTLNTVEGLGFRVGLRN